MEAVPSPSRVWKLEKWMNIFLDVFLIVTFTFAIFNMWFDSGVDLMVYFLRYPVLLEFAAFLTMFLQLRSTRHATPLIMPTLILHCLSYIGVVVTCSLVLLEEGNIPITASMITVILFHFIIFFFKLKIAKTPQGSLQRNLPQMDASFATDPSTFRISMTLKCIFLSIGWAVATGILTFMSVIGVSLSTLLYSGLSSTLVLISAYLLVAVIYSCITKCKVMTDTPPSDHHGEKPLETKPSETPHTSADIVPNINEACQKDTGCEENTTPQESSAMATGSSLAEQSVHFAKGDSSTAKNAETRRKPLCKHRNSCTPSNDSDSGSAIPDGSERSDNVTDKRLTLSPCPSSRSSGNSSLAVVPLTDQIQGRHSVDLDLKTDDNLDRTITIPKVVSGEGINQENPEAKQERNKLQDSSTMANRSVGRQHIHFAKRGVGASNNVDDLRRALLRKQRHSFTPSIDSASARGSRSSDDVAMNHLTLSPYPSSSSSLNTLVAGSGTGDEIQDHIGNLDLKDDNLDCSVTSPKFAAGEDIIQEEPAAMGIENETYQAPESLACSAPSKNVQEVEPVQTLNGRGSSISVSMPSDNLSQVEPTMRSIAVQTEPDSYVTYL